MGEYDGVLTDSRHNERNEGDGMAIKMMGLCISHMSHIVIGAGIIGGGGQKREKGLTFLLYTLNKILARSCILSLSL